MPFVYKPKTIFQLRGTYYKRSRLGMNGFESFKDFHNWYQEQELICHYCGLTEIESQTISMTGILNSKRFPQNGVVKRGKNRGVWLEVDRILPNENYSRENCVLCCYFCNNDKSDIFAGIDYVNFFQNMLIYLKNLLNENRNLIDY